MSEPTPPSPNGYVRQHEFVRHIDDAKEKHEEMKSGIKANDDRIDKLESWRDRVAGPIAFLLALLALVAMGSNVAVVWLGFIA